MVSHIGKVELGSGLAYACFNNYYKWLMESTYAPLIGSTHPMKTLWALQWKG